MRIDVIVSEHLARHRQLAQPDVARVVLDPAGLGEMLGKLLGRAAADAALVVEQDGARTGRALIQGENEFFHLV